MKNFRFRRIKEFLTKIKEDDTYIDTTSTIDLFKITTVDSDMISTLKVKSEKSVELEYITGI